MTITGIVLLDLKKVFDTVDHQILLSNLCKYIIGPHALRWFRSYLTDRYQVTMVHGVKSIRHVACGVAQGSILGPMLFVVYINDLSNTLTVVKLAYTWMTQQCPMVVDHK